jgi:hypothetical protein
MPLAQLSLLQVLLQEQQSRRMTFLLSLISILPRAGLNVFSKSPANAAHVKRPRKYQQQSNRNDEVGERRAYAREETHPCHGVSRQAYDENQGNTNADEFYGVKRALLGLMQSADAVFRINPLQLGV